jgi:hypothetical protein
MAFFAPEPDQPEPEFIDPPTYPWQKPPYEESPAFLPISELLAVNENAAIALVGVRVFREGAEFVIERKIRRGKLSQKDWEDKATFGARGAGRMWSQRLRFGVALSDGEKVTDDFKVPFTQREPPERHVLVPTGGGGHGDHRSFEYSDKLWLWPLPRREPWSSSSNGQPRTSPRPELT